MEFEQPDRLRHRLVSSREEYAQRLLTSLIVGGPYPAWNSRNETCTDGAAYLEALWDLSFTGYPWPGGACAYVDEFNLPARTPAERGCAPDQAVEWADVLWLIELKTEKASHSPAQIPDSLTLARHHHPGKQIFFTYLTPPATYVFDLPDWVTFAHLNWGDALPVIRRVWGSPTPPQRATVNGLVDVLANLHLTRADFISTLSAPVQDQAVVSDFEGAFQEAKALAASTSEDRAARALDWAAPSLEALDELRLQVRGWLADTPPGSPRRHVVPWTWSATTTDGLPKTTAGRLLGFELRFSYYTTAQY